MTRFISLGFATAALAAIFLAAGCSPENELVPIDGDGGGSGSKVDTGADKEVPVTVDDPPAGAGATNTYKFQDGVVVADPAYVAAVTVANGTLTAPTAGHEAILGQLQAGTVFMGDRAPNLADTNPEGFLRRVVAVRTEGANTIVDTTQASMEDLFAEANFGGGGDPTSAVETQSGGLQLLDTGGAGTSFNLSANLGELVATSGADKLKGSGNFSLSVQPRVNFKYETHYFSAPDVEIDVQIAFRRLFGLCLKAEIQGGGFSVSEKSKAKTFPLGTVRLPIPVPLPLVVTAKFQSEATCTFAPTGVFGYASQVENNSRMRVRFGIQDGTSFHGADWPDTPNTTRFEVLLSGGIKAECKASIKGGVYFYDRVGGFFEVAPSVSAEAAGYGKYSSGGGLEGQICGGAETKFQVNAGLEADVWIAKWSRKWNLLEKKFPIPGLPTPACVGTARASDGCGGRPDGAYCSATDPKKGYKCRAGATAGGLSCTSGFCKDTGFGSFAQTSGDALNCVDTQPAATKLDLSFCPNGNPK